MLSIVHLFVLSGEGKAQSHTEPKPEAKIGVEDWALMGPRLLLRDQKPVWERTMFSEVLAKKWLPRSHCKSTQVRTDVSQLFRLVPGVIPILIHLQNQMKQKSGWKTILPPLLLRCKTSAAQTRRPSQQARPSGCRDRICTKAYTGLHKGCTFWT